jgi:membrane protein
MAESQLETGEQLESIWRLGGISARELAKRTWAAMDRNDVSSTASELAYNFVFSIFPALFVLLTVFGFFVGQHAEMQQTLFDYLSRVLPSDAANLLTRTVSQITQASGGGKLTFGLLLALWSASQGTSGMMSGLNRSYQLHEGRPYYKSKAISIGLTIALAGLVTLALVIVLFGGNIAQALGAKLGLADVTIVAWRVIQWIVAVLIMTFAFALVYYFGPDIKEQHWYWITPGSLIGVLLWLATSYVFRVYLHYFNSYNKMYGSLGAAMILLMWFWVTGLAFLVGGEINAEIEHAAAKHGHPEAKAPGQKAA